MTVIPDWTTADRIGRTAIADGALSYAVFSYQQPRTGLTLYGIEITALDGSKQEYRMQ